MYRMPAEKLQSDKRQEDASRQNGNEEVLSFLQETHFTSRDQVGEARVRREATLALHFLGQ